MPPPPPCYSRTLLTLSRPSRCSLFEPRSIESPFQSSRLRMVVFSHFLLNLHRIPDKLNLLRHQQTQNTAQAYYLRLLPDQRSLNELIATLRSDLHDSSVSHFQARWHQQRIEQRIESARNNFRVNQGRAQDQNQFY